MQSHLSRQDIILGTKYWGHVSVDIVDSNIETPMNDCIHVTPRLSNLLVITSENKAVKILATCLSNGQDQDKLKMFFYETIYGTTKFEFCKFTSTEESSVFLEVVQKAYYHSQNFDFK